MKMIAEIYIYIFFYKSLQVSYVLIDLLSVDVRKNCQCVLKIIQISNTYRPTTSLTSFISANNNCTLSTIVPLRSFFGIRI